MSKIEESELQQINDLRSKLTAIVDETGQYSLRVELLKSDIAELQKMIEEKANDFKKLLIEEEEIVKRLSEKYGTGSIDFETGEFVPEK